MTHLKKIVQQKGHPQPLSQTLILCQSMPILLVHSWSRKTFRCKFWATRLAQ